jgi:general secretion pathway protein G
MTRARAAAVRSRTGGFTLLELMLVVVIIGILAAAIIPNLTGKANQARITQARQDMAGALSTALYMYEQDLGAFPTTEQGLAALVVAPTGASNWKGPYIRSGVVPGDPWGNPYIYRFPGSTMPTLYDLSCAGPDGKAGTDDDIFPDKKK